jgi:hypothetical protein
MSHFDDYSIGDDSGDILFSSSEDNRSALHALLGSAQRRIEIYTHDLEPRIYNDDVILNALKRLAIGHPRSRIRVLVHDPDRVIKYGHRLIGLSRSLTSSIQIRRTHDEYIGAQGFVVADQRGLLFKQHSDRYEGLVNFNAPQPANERLAFFDDAWEHSTEVTDLKRLYI